MHGGERVDITPDILLRAYAAGIFPMAEDEDDPSLFWVEPRERGIIPLDGFHVPQRLARKVRADLYEVRVDRDFDAVIAGCAGPRTETGRTWINRRIRRLYGELFDLGQCHTVEVYSGERLVGGLYGVRLGGVFFGESMFHREPDASKVALVHLVARLRQGDFRLLDTQFVTPHLAQFGAAEVPRRVYKGLLKAAIEAGGEWYAWPRERAVPGAEALRAIAGA